MMTEADVVYIVDDDSGLRESLGELLSAKGLATKQFSSGEAFLGAIKGDETGCVLLDYHLGGCNGLEVIKALREADHSIPVVMITAHGEVQLAVDAMRAGASDFVEKPWARDTLFDAVDRAMDSCKKLQERIVARQAAMDAIVSLTPREKDVFDELIKGASNKLIARALDLSPRTVEFYRANVLEKTGANGVAGLVRLAFLAREIDL